MAKKTRKKSSYKHDHEKFVRQQNEWCFLKDKQKVKYHSFILLELFPLEKISNLIKGLDELYKDVSASQKNRLKYGDVLKDSHSKIFQWNTLNLPYITTTKLKGKVLPNCAFHDLGENIRHLHISIYKILPSYVILQIQVYLDEKISKKINDVIYKYHKEKKIPVKTPKGEYTKIYSPANQKTTEINQIKEDLHKEAIDFLRTYFEGFFFELSEKQIPIVPYIDVLSLDYPESEEDISKWGLDNSNFFQCFNTCIISYECFKYENYLLCIESRRDSFSNYVIYANRKTSENNMYPDIDSAIEEKLNFCCFDILAIDRWLKIQESVVGEINGSISEEITKIEENQIGKALKTRKRILSKIFSFARFKAEFKRYDFIPDKFNFESIKDLRKPERKINLFKGFKECIEARINDIDSLINNFTRQYETILNLKNIEFSKNMQLKVLILTIIIIVLTLAQITIGIIGLKRPDLIIKILTGG